MAFSRKVKKAYHTQKNMPFWLVEEGLSYININEKPKDGATIYQDASVSSVFHVQVGLRNFHKKCECVTGYRYFYLCMCWLWLG